MCDSSAADSRRSVKKDGVSEEKVDDTFQSPAGGPENVLISELLTCFCADFQRGRLPA